MAYIRIETLGYDGLTSNIIAGPQYIGSSISSDKGIWEGLEMSQASSGEKMFYFIQNGLQKLSKYLAVSMIPTFSFLAPIGIFFLCRKLDYKKITLIITLIVFLMPAFYAYSRDIQEYRYLFILFPIFSVVSMFTLRSIFIKSNESSKIFVVFLIGFLLFSAGYLVYFSPDLERENEAFALAMIIKDTTKKINSHYPEEQYLIHVQKFSDLEKFPVASTSIPRSDNFIVSLFDANISAVINTDSVEGYIKAAKDEGLTHLVTDGKNAEPKFLNDIFYNEKNYPYLFHFSNIFLQYLGLLFYKVAVELYTNFH